MHVRYEHTQKKIIGLVFILLCAINTHFTKQTSVHQSFQFALSSGYTCYLYSNSQKSLHEHSTKNLIILFIFDIKSINCVCNVLINRLLLHTQMYVCIVSVYVCVPTATTIIDNDDDK